MLLYTSSYCVIHQSSSFGIVHKLLLYLIFHEQTTTFITHRHKIYHNGKWLAKHKPYCPSAIQVHPLWSHAKLRNKRECGTHTTQLEL